MHARRSRYSRPAHIAAVGLLSTGLVVGLTVLAPAPSAGQPGVVAPTVVTVTAGKPTEYAFKLSKSSALPWSAATRSSRVTFKVSNAGALAHAFKVCTDPLESALATSCRGVGTPSLKPGRSASLTITFTTRGTYEYLSPVAGQAAKGMKGAIGIGVTLPKPPGKTTTPATTTTTPSAAAPSSPSTPSTPTTPAAPIAGETAAGAAVWASAGCGGCHSINDVRPNIGPDLNARHPGPFNSGPLTATQLADLTAYVNSR